MITVATIANATALLNYWGWNGAPLSPEAWAVIMLVAAAVIAAAVGITRGDIAYIAVIVWAFVGIAIKHWDTPVVGVTALLMAALVALSLVIGVPAAARRLRYPIVA